MKFHDLEIGDRFHRYGGPLVWVKKTERFAHLEGSDRPVPTEIMPWDRLIPAAGDRSKEKRMRAKLDELAVYLPDVARFLEELDQ